MEVNDKKTTNMTTQIFNSDFNQNKIDIRRVFFREELLRAD